MNSIVIGSGISGLCSAYSLSKTGCNVILIEKELNYGGNGKNALTGINIIQSNAQDARGIIDSISHFKRDIYYAGSNQNDPTLVDLLVSKSKYFVEEFLNELDINLTDLVNSGGHSIARTHKPANWPLANSQPIGSLLVNKLISKLSSMSNVQLLSNCHVTKLNVEEVTLSCGTKDKQVTSVVYMDSLSNEIVLPAKTVIVCTGGYMACRRGSSLLAEFTADLCTFATASGEHADGEGIKLVRSIGGELIHMNHVQFDACGIINQTDPSKMTKDILPSLIRSAGAILINSEGKRICNELDLSKKISTAILHHCKHHHVRLTSGREQHVAYVLINPEVLSHIERDAASILQHENAGKSYGRIEDFCKEYNIPLDNIQETFNEYKKAAHVGNDHFGKKVFPVHQFNLNDPLWMVEVTPVLHHSNGGIKINASTEVTTTRSDGTSSVILGLYAAGECTGGVNGTERLVGNGLLESIVFGTTAGLRASQTILNDSVTSLETWTPLKLRYRIKRPYLLLDGIQHPENEELIVDDIPTDVYEFCFDLPSSFSTMTIPVGGAVAVRAKVNGTEIIRHYTPISVNQTRGSISLYLKSLPNRGTMSRHLFFLRPGYETLEFMGPTHFPKLKYAENGIKLYPSKLVLIAGGSGISPMIQMINDVILRGVDCKIILFWGVKSQREFVFRHLLDEIVRKHPEKLQIIYSAHETLESVHANQVHIGHIDTNLLSKHLSAEFGNTEDNLNIIICGPQKMSATIISSLLSLEYHNDKIFTYNP